MPRSFISARDQVAMTAPWHIALDLAPDARSPGRNPNGWTPSPKPEAPAPEVQPWMQTDWRTATDYGHFHSTSRPPMGSDIPHPSETLDPTNPDHTKYRVINKKNAKDGSTVSYHLPSRIDAAANSADPERDPYGVMTPYDKVTHTSADGVETDISHEFHLGHGNTPQDLATNNLDHHNAQTPDQAYQGRHWYRAAHEGTKDLSDKTIGDHPRVVHTMSAFSPKTQWDENLEKGHHFLTQYGGDPNNPPVIPGLQSPVRKAMDIYHAQGDSYLDANSGPKTGAFAKNILDGTPLRPPRAGHDDDTGYYDHPTNPVTGEQDWRMHPDQDQTVDTHDVRMKNTPHGDQEALRNLKYGTPPHFEDSFMHNGQRIHPGYDLYSRMGAEATHAANLAEQDPARHLIPKQMQAGPWGKFKTDLDVATNNTAPEPGQRPKGLTDQFTKKKNLDRPQDEVEQEWAEKNKLNDKAIPRYQRDPSDWMDPRRPKFDPASAEGLYKRIPQHRRSFVEGGAWDGMFSEYLRRNPQHPEQAAFGAHMGSFEEGPVDHRWFEAASDHLSHDPHLASVQDTLNWVDDLIGHDTW